MLKCAFLKAYYKRYMSPTPLISLISYNIDDKWWKEKVFFLIFTPFNIV